MSRVKTGATRGCDRQGPVKGGTCFGKVAVPCQVERHSQKLTFRVSGIVRDMQIARGWERWDDGTEPISVHMDMYI